MGRLVSFFVGNKKRILNLIIYFVGIFALRGVSLILTPLYTRLFTTAEYGTMELANSIVAFLGTVLGLGMCQYLGVEYFHYKDTDRTLAVEKNIKMFCFIATPIAVIVLFLNWSGILFVVGLDKQLFTLVVFVSYLTYFSNLCFMLCKNQQRTTLMTVLQLVTGILSLLLNIIGVCILGLGIYSTLITTAIVYVILLFFIPMVYKFNIKFGSIKLQYQEIKGVLLISIPLAVTGLVNSILLLGDRWVLNYYCSASEIGIYSLAAKFGSIFELIIVNTLTIFYAPHVYKSYQDIGIERTEKRNRENFLRYMIGAMVSVAVFMIAVKMVFPILIDARYAESETYLWIILIGEIFFGATYFKTYLINYEKKTKIILFINVVAMIFNLSTNLILIPRYQIWAAAGTTAASYMIMFFFAMMFNNREFKKARMRK